MYLKYLFRAAVLISAPHLLRSQDSACPPADVHSAVVFAPIGSTCVAAAGGFTSTSGSFASLALTATNRLGLGERLGLSAQYGLQLRQLQAAFTKGFLAGGRLEAGFAVTGARSNFDQARDASILAFSRDVPQFESSNPDTLLNYVMHQISGTAFANLRLPKSFSRLGVAYTYKLTGIRPLTPAAGDYLYRLNFLTAGQANGLSGMSTSESVVSCEINTVNHPLRPNRGRTLTSSFRIAGLGGDTRSIEPSLDFKWFHPGLHRNHVVAVHASARLLTGYGGKAAPPFERYKMGGEDEVRGFAGGSLSPFDYMLGKLTIPVLNNDGTVRTNKIISGGTVYTFPVTMQVPVCRPLMVGGDTKVLGAIEYRVHLAGPFTLALFTDAGANRASFRRAFRLNDGTVAQLKSDFPDAEITPDARFAASSQNVRMSTGLELQVLIPRPQIPIRFFWAYNLQACRYALVVLWSEVPACGNLTPPVIASPSTFPNPPTFYNALAQMSRMGALYRDPRTLFRAAVGFSF